MSNSTPEVLQADRLGAALLLPAFIVLSLVAYLGLVLSFGFPDILRQPAPEILAAFRAHASAVRGFYYLFAIAHLVLAAGVLVLHRALRAGEGPWLLVATGGGVLYGIAQTAGFLRWPMLVPLYAERMADASLNAGQAESVLLVLESFHRYAGVALGENLSFWGMAAWLMGLGVTLWRNPLRQRALGALSLAAGALVVVYTFEQLGGRFAVLAPLLMLSHGLAYGLALALSWSLWKTAPQSQHLAPVGPVPASAIALFIAALVLPGLP